MELYLKCNQMKEPIGVTKDKICLSFEYDGEQEFEGYWIRIASSKNKLNLAKADLVDEYIRDNRCLVYYYNGTGLDDGQIVYWQIILKTSGQYIASRITFFEVGLSNYPGEWIGNPQFDGSVSEFRKEFFCDGVDEARLYICGLGFFDCELNGKKLNHDYFKPLLTDYAKREKANNERIYDNSDFSVTYYTYKISNILVPGKNLLTVRLAGGYYFNTDKIEEEPDFSYGEPKLWFVCKWKSHGKTVCLESDKSCLVRNTNLRSSLYCGNIMDFSGMEHTFQESKVTEFHPNKMVSPSVPSDSIEKFLIPEKILKQNDSILYDFGINHSGSPQMEVIGKRGSKLVIKYAEILNEDGAPNYHTGLWEAYNERYDRMHRIYQQDEYVLSGNLDVIRPQFCWHCYRYMSVICEADTELRSVSSAFIHTDIGQDGIFESSEPLFNELYEKFVLTLKDNLHCGIISDCPHREKLPYTGDGQIIMPACFTAFDSEALYRKWLDDILAAQDSKGWIPYSAPNLGGGGGYNWGNALVNVSDFLFRYTGDIEIVQKCFPAICRWIAYYQRRHEGDYIIKYNSHKWMLSDWLAPEMMQFNVPFMNTMCFFRAVSVAEKFAKILCREESKIFQALKEKIAEAVNSRFFDEAKVCYCRGVQGENILPLMYGIVPEPYEELLKEKVALFYTKTLNKHLDTGIVMTPILLEYLTENGLAQLAYDIVTADTEPSYRTMMQGETTYPEHWSKKWPDYQIDGESSVVKGGGDLSHCHPMFGSVVSWIVKYVAGLNLENLSQGEVIFHPMFISRLNSARASKHTKFGEAAIGWEKQNKLKIRIKVPPNLKGVFQVDSEEKAAYVSGREKFVEINQGNGFFIRFDPGDWTIKI